MGRVEEYDGNEVSPSCSDGIRWTYERYNVTGAIVDNALALLSKRGIEGTAHEICALTAREPIEAVRALCRAGKSVFPADWAYAAIAKLGQNIESKDVERFGQSARDSFAKQCEFTRFLFCGVFCRASRLIFRLITCCEVEHSGGSHVSAKQGLRNLHYSQPHPRWL